MISFLKDVKFALRQLRTQPGFTVVAVVVLALGLGASAAIFSVVNAVLLQPLPYPHPKTLIEAFEKDVVQNGSDDSYNSVSPNLFRDWQTEAHSLSSLSAVRSMSFTLSSESQSFKPERVNGIACSPTFTKVLGVQPVLGRFFTASEDQYEGPYVAVISYGFWQQHFSGSGEVLKKQVRLDGNSYDILGVLPKSFVYPGQPSQVFVPFKHTLSVSNRNTYSNHFFQAIGRLAPGYSSASAQQELTSIIHNARRTHPDEIMGRSATVIGLNAYLVRDVKAGLLVLLGAVGCLLLIACVNTANLLLTRSVSRRRELTIRLAVGANRLQIIRQLLIEGMTVSLLGAAAGLIVSEWASSFLVKYAPGADYLPQVANIHTNTTVVLFTIGLALLSGMCAGLFPALIASRADLVHGLKESSRSATSSRSQGHLRDVLVGLEMAISLVLLVAAGLLLHSFVNLLKVSPGFRADNSATFDISLPSASYQNRQKVSNFIRQFAEDLRATPGAASAGLVSYPPLAGHQSDSVFHIKGHPLPPGSMMDLVNQEAEPGYFRAMGIPLLRGRIFARQDGIGFDEKHPKLGAVVITQNAARKFFHTLNPIGQILEAGTDAGVAPDASGNPYPEYQIVGVVGDVPTSPEIGVEPALYSSLLDGQNSRFYGVVHTYGDPLLLRSRIQAVVQHLDPDLSVHNLRTFAQIDRESTSDRRFSASLLVFFAVVALTLAAVGIYGVVSHAVTQRTTEIGIRMALGATRTEVSRLVVLDGMRPAVFGLAAGLLASLWISSLFKSLLFGISTFDGMTFLAVPIVLAFAMAAACLIPALRASRIDPTVALRDF